MCQNMTDLAIFYECMLCKMLSSSWTMEWLAILTCLFHGACFIVWYMRPLQAMLTVCVSLSTFQFRKRRCITQSQCKKMGLRTKNTERAWKMFNNECREECPNGYMADEKDLNACKPCDGPCPRGKSSIKNIIVHHRMYRSFRTAIFTSGSITPYPPPQLCQAILF